MIKKFSVLYVGHIALDNVGRDGDEHRQQEQGFSVVDTEE